MISNRPYLLRAFYQWIIDSGCAPILVIDANFPHNSIPLEHAEEGEIVFNISPSAIRDLNITNDLVEFRASFSGVVHLISVPVKSILALYAEENGEGIFFDEEEDNESPTSFVGLEEVPNLTQDPIAFVPTEQEKPVKAKPFLRLVEKTSE